MLKLITVNGFTLLLKSFQHSLKSGLITTKYPKSSECQNCLLKLALKYHMLLIYCATLSKLIINIYSKYTYKTMRKNGFDVVLERTPLT